MQVLKVCFTRLLPVCGQDAEESQIKVQVCIYAFDLLYLNGESLVQKPFRTRRQLLRDNFTEVEGEFVFAKSMISSNTEEIEDFLEESIKGKEIKQKHSSVHMVM